MKKVIVTGATGFIGGAFTRKLLKQGVKVYGIDVSADKLKEMKKYGDFIPVVADFSVYNKLNELVDDKCFDAFFHFAWQGVFGNAFKDYELQLNNAKYSCDAIVEAKKLNCKKFIMAGTQNEIEIKTFINSNSFSPRYTCIYSSSKLAAELICKTLAYNLDIEYNAGLISMAYGEGNESQTLPNIVINQLLNNISPKLIEGNNYYDMIYIDDIVDAFIAISEKGGNFKSYYVGHRRLKIFRDLITEIRDIVNPSVDLLFGEFNDGANIDYSQRDLDALYNDTGFECKSDFHESIQKTAEWLKARNAPDTHTHNMNDCSIVHVVWQIVFTAERRWRHE